MQILEMLKRSLTGKQQRNVPNAYAHSPMAAGNKANIAQLPDEIIEMITTLLCHQDLSNLRQSNKRVALVTTHLLATRCTPHRICANADESLKVLIQGSRIPLLNGTASQLILIAPGWKSPLASYGAGLREVRLLRLTTLTLCSMRISQSSDLLHFLNSHLATLRRLHLRDVHAQDLPSWREVLIRVAKMHRLQTLELRKLFYSVGHARNRTATFLLPRSTYDKVTPVETESGRRSSLTMWEDKDDPVVAQTPKEIGQLIDDFFASNGELKKDFGHEQLLAAASESWTRTAKKRLIRFGT